MDFFLLKFNFFFIYLLNWVFSISMIYSSSVYIYFLVNIVSIVLRGLHSPYWFDLLFVRVLRF